MKIFLVEDDPIWQSKMHEILHELNYRNIHFFNSLITLQKHLSEEKPELIIADILLGESDIFELFDDKKYHELPFLFITSSENILHYNRTKNIAHASYLVKPFHSISVKAAIDNVMHYHPQNKIANEPKGLVVKGNYNEKITLLAKDIVYVKANWNYSILKTPKNQFAIKCPFNEIMKHLGSDIIRIHKSYLVNCNQIKNINIADMVVVTPLCTIPIGRTYKQNLLEYLCRIKQL